MVAISSTPRIFAALSSLAIFIAMCVCTNAQSTSTLQGRVVDSAGAVVDGAEITAVNHATGVTRMVKPDNEGNYQVAALPVGNYLIKVLALGFRPQVVESISIEVQRTMVLDFQISVGDISQGVNVTPAGQMIERATVSVGHVIGRQMVQEI